MSDLQQQREATAAVIEEIAEERLRQVGKEGYDAAHDDEHDRDELAIAAACYAAPFRIFVRDERAAGTFFKDPWPFEERFDKRPYNGNTLLGGFWSARRDRRRLLVIAAAFLVAEIERLDRQRKKPA